MFACVRLSSRVLTVEVERCAVRWKGHSKWQNIRHTKAATDASINKLNNYYIMQLGLAVKGNNDFDPARNKTLSRVVKEALANKVSRELIDKTLKRLKNGEKGLEEHIVSVRGPDGAHFLVTVVAKNSQLAISAVGARLRKVYGVVETGSRSAFAKFGEVLVQVRPSSTESASKVNFSEDDALAMALDCGAERVDVSEPDDQTMQLSFTCAANDLHTVKNSIAGQCRELSKEKTDVEMTTIYANVDYRPTSTIEPSDDVSRAKMLAVLKQLQSADNVRRVLHNIKADEDADSE